LLEPLGHKRPFHPKIRNPKSKIAHAWGLIPLFIVFLAALSPAATINVTAKVDPLTRYVHLQYDVPADAPKSILVQCTYQLNGQKDWKPAAVKRYRSEAAETAVQDTGTIDKELATGQVTEPLAAGRTRTLIWQNDLQLPPGHSYAPTVRVELFDPQHKPLAQGQTEITVDLSDVVALNESMIYVRLPMQKPGGKPGWVWRHDLPGSPPQGMLDVNERPGRLDPLAFMPKLKGYYAIFVTVPNDPSSEIDLRLASDEFYQRFPGDKSKEYFWKIAKMDGENLIASQSWRTIELPKDIGDAFASRLKQLRFVPINPKLYSELTRLDHFKRDKLIHAYFEIYSWAYLNFVDRNSLFLEPIAAYADAKVDAVDAQLGRFGAKPQYPSLIEPALVGDTIGDPEPGGVPPTNSNVGLLGLYTACWRAVDVAGKGMGVPVIANLGAGNAYPSQAMEGNFAKAHPQWMSKDKQWVQYKFKPVRDYCLSMYKEILDRGATRLSIDFCRYPYVIDKPETATLFLTELRALADHYAKGGQRVKINVRFPVPEVKGGDAFDPRPWVAQNLIDCLSPSCVTANGTFSDPTPYIKMTRGTSVKCLPCIDLLPEGPIWPTGVLQWAKHLYDLGADGIYFYQADARIVGTMMFRAAIGHHPLIARLGSSRAVDEMMRQYDQEQDNFGTGIYIYYPAPYTTIRPKVWIEGGNVQEVQYFLDGKPIAGRTTPPYEIGLEGWKHNFPIMSKATFEVRAKINGQWLVEKQDFQIHPDYNN
jgi:hypothetical protein